jgi:hypothetical protein
MGRREQSHAAFGRGLDQQRDMLVERIGVVHIVSETVCGREQEIAAREVHRRLLLAQSDMERGLVVLRVVRDPRCVGNVRAQWQIAV